MDYTTTIPLELFETHKFKTTVFCCIDPRYLGTTYVEFAMADKSQGGLGLTTPPDILAIPGACKGIAEENPTTTSFVRSFFDLVIPAHGTEWIVVVHHPGCAAYSIQDAEEESKTQRAHIHRGVEILRGWYPDISFSEFIIETKKPQEGKVPLTYRAI